MQAKKTTAIDRIARRISHCAVAFLAVAVLMALAPPLQAQTTATISGTITDPTGAVVPGATVTITNEFTGDARKVETNKEGFFSVPNLLPSTYTVEAVAQGFVPKKVTGVDLHAGDEVRVPTFILTVGAVTDTVTVESVAGQILTLESAERTATLEYQDIQDMALAGRDTTELLKVLPGVVQVGNSGYNDLSTTTGNSAIGNGMGINGVPYKGGTALNMDGANILDIGDDFSGLATVNPEMTQEVQVQSSNFGADTANGPVVINTTGRSGGERYHGEAYFYARNDILNANDWQDNHHTNAAGGWAPNPKAGAAYYYPGGSFSGPIPRTNKKLFFFAAIELPYQNQGNANIIRASIPTPAMLGGDFSTDDPNNLILCPQGFINAVNNNNYGQNTWCQNIANTGGNTQYTIFADGTSPTAVNSGPAQTGYTNGGKIPSQYLDPNMQDFTKVWPAWNSPYIATTSQQIINNGGWNYLQPFINHDNGWVARGRLDYNWNSTNQFFISYQQSYDQQFSGGCGEAFYSGCSNGNLQYPGGGLQKQTFSKTLNGHYVHIFSPTLTNEAIASWVWGNIPILPGNNPAANFRTTLGFTAGCVYCGNNPPKYMPTFGGVQYAYPGVTQPDDWEPNNYYIVQKQVPTFADNLTKVVGRHTLKFGGMTSNTDNYQGNQSTNLQGTLSIGGNPANNFNYFAKQSTCASGVCGSYTGNMGSYNNLANFLTGNLTSYGESNSSPLSDVAYQTIAFYAQDQIKVNKQFSVSVGARFEHIGWWYDREGVGLAVFYPSRVLPDFYAGKYAPGFYWHGIDGSLPLSGRPNRFGFLSPRLGLSYDVFGNSKTLLRGGWGAYRYQEAANGPQAALNTAQGVKNFGASSYTAQNSTFLLSQIGQLQSLAPNCQVQCAQTGQTGYDPNDYGLPLNYAYNFTIDQQLPWKMLLDVGYVGNRATHLSDNGQDGVSSGGYANQNKTPLYAYGKLVGGQWVGNLDTFTNKVICNPENLNATCSSGSAAADFQPFGRGTGCTSTANPTCTIYGAAGVTMVQNVDYQNYNALQVQIVKRAGPITVNANFTWSKSLGTVVTYDPFHIHPNNTYDNLNRPIIFNSSYIYREPNFWHGNRFVGGAVNGWTISGVTLWQQGTNGYGGISIQYDPRTLPTGTNPQSLSVNTRGVGQATFFGTNAGIVTGRPQLTCNAKAGLVKYQLYRPCFTAAAFGSPGGIGLPFVAGQAFMENDLSIRKSFTVHEQQKLGVTISAFNWLNHSLPTFGSGESTTEYYFYDYNTHAVTINDTCATGQAYVSPAPGSCNPGSPIVASNVYGNANGNPSNLYGTQHFKSAFGGNTERILELDMKYSF
jgi:hypothetical protein